MYLGQTTLNGAMFHFVSEANIHTAVKLNCCAIAN